MEHYKCTKCGELFLDPEGEQSTTAAEIVLPKPVHESKLQYVAADETVSCIKTGNGEYWFCPDCRQKYATNDRSQPISDSRVLIGYGPHTIDPESFHPAVDPTCDQSGNVAYYTCSVCDKKFADTEGETLLENVTVAPRHTLTEHPAVARTCTQNGSRKYYSCSVCGAFFDENYQPIQENEWIVTAGHDFVGHPETAPTCRAEGNALYYTCNGCGIIVDASGNVTSLDAVTTAKLPHSITIHVEAEPKTCEDSGNVEYWECEVCGARFADSEGSIPLDNVIIPPSHNLVATEAHAATCTDDGNIAYWTCQDCEKIFNADGQQIWLNDTIEKAHGHTTERIPAQDPTCTEAGHMEYYRCTACGNLFSDPVGYYPASPDQLTIKERGHDYIEHAAKEPTFTEEGNALYYSCSICDNLFDAEYNETTWDKIAVALPSAPTAKLSAPVAKREANRNTSNGVDPIRISINYDKTSVSIGDVITATYSISGGNNNYSCFYNWQEYSGGTWINQNILHANSQQGTLSYTPTIGTKVRLYFHADDSVGRSSYSFGDEVPIYRESDRQQITMNGGKAFVDGTEVTDAIPGTTINIIATGVEGKTFNYWTAEGIILNDSSSSQTSFVMPNNSVTLTAINTDAGSLDTTPPLVITRISKSSSSQIFGSQYRIMFEVGAFAQGGTGEPYLYKYDLLKNGIQAWTTGWSELNGCESEAAGNGTCVLRVSVKDSAGHIATYDYDLLSSKSLRSVVIVNGSAYVNGSTSVFAREGDSVTITANVPNGKEFYRWVSSGITLSDTQRIQPTTSFTMPDNTVRLEAVMKCKVTFDMKGHGLETAPAVQHVIPGNKATRPPTNPSDNGIVFVNWYADPECTTLFDFNQDITQDTTVYASWKCQVTYETKYGNKPESKLISIGGKAPVPTTPTKEGYKVDGWYLNSNFSGDEYFQNPTDINSNATLYAKWSGDLQITKGNHGTAHYGDPYSFTLNCSYGQVKDTLKVYTDNSTEELEKRFYTISSGSTVVTLSEEYVRTLSAGEHTIKFVTGVNDLGETTGRFAVSTEPQKYSITMHDGTATVEGTTVTEAAAGVTVTITAAVKTRKPFEKWTVKDNEITLAHPATSPTTFIMPKKNLEITANYKNVVTFEKGLASTITVRNMPANQTLASNEKIDTTKVSNPTADGYRFLGWFTQATGGITFDFTQDISTDTNVYAHWIKTWNVTFTTDHGTITNPSINPLNIDDGGKVSEPPALSWIGYTWGGWYSGTEAFNFARTEIHENTTIHAKWNPDLRITKGNAGTAYLGSDYAFTLNYYYPDYDDNKNQFEVFVAGSSSSYDRALSKNHYDVSYDASNRVVVTLNAAYIQTLTDGETYKIRFNTGLDIPPKDLGYKDGTFEVSTAPKTKFTVTFDQGEVSEAKNMPESQIIEKGGKATEPKTDPTATGYRFLGWYANSEKTTVFDFSKTKINDDTTIYAKWIKTHTVKFMTEHGIAPDKQVIDEGGKATKPTDPKMSGYKFEGWYKDSKLKTAFNWDTPIKEDTTLYGKWKSNLEITKGDGGTAHYGSEYEFTLNCDFDQVYIPFELIIGSKTVDPDLYELSGTKNGTIVTLKKALVRSLTSGSHTVVFDTGIDDLGKVSGTLKVSTSPKTGDESDIGLWIAVGCLSAVAAAAIVVYLIRKKK